MSKGYIYAWYDETDTVNGQVEIRYVGQTKNLNSRTKDHLKSKVKDPFHDWLRSRVNQGRPVGVKVLAEVELKDLDRYEIHFIAHYKQLGHRLLNLTEGGNKPPVLKGEASPMKRPELRQQVSERMRGEGNHFYGQHISGPEHPMFGRKQSDEARAKMKENHPRLSREDHPMFGRHHTDEHKRAIAEKMKGNQHGKGYKHTEEQKRRKTEARKRDWENPEYRAKMHEARKKMWEDPEYRARMIESRRKSREKKKRDKGN